jgi:hypothetical protein
LKRQRDEEEKRKAEKEKAFDAEQAILFNDPSRYNLLELVRSSSGANRPKKVLKRLEHLYKGTPATCHGPNKTFTLVDQKGLVELLEKIKLPGLILLVDEEWKESRPVQTRQDMLNACKGAEIIRSIFST